MPSQLTFSLLYLYDYALLVIRGFNHLSYAIADNSTVIVVTAKINSLRSMTKSDASLRNMVGILACDSYRGLQYNSRYLFASTINSTMALSKSLILTTKRDITTSVLGAAW